MKRSLSLTLRVELVLRACKDTRAPTEREQERELPGNRRPSEGNAGPAGSRASPGDEPSKSAPTAPLTKSTRSVAAGTSHPRLRRAGTLSFPGSLCPPGTHPRWPQCTHSAGAARKLREDTFTSGLQGFGASETGQDKTSSPGAWGLPHSQGKTLWIPWLHPK